MYFSTASRTIHETETFLSSGGRLTVIRVVLGGFSPCDLRPDCAERRQVHDRFNPFFDPQHGARGRPTARTGSGGKRPNSHMELGRFDPSLWPRLYALF
jgi:hypothetical protein